MNEAWEKDDIAYQNIFSSELRAKKCIDSLKSRRICFFFSTQCRLSLCPVRCLKQISASRSEFCPVNGPLRKRVGRNLEQYFRGCWRAHVCCLGFKVLCETSPGLTKFQGLARSSGRRLGLQIPYPPLGGRSLYSGKRHGGKSSARTFPSGCLQSLRSANSVDRNISKVHLD